MDDIRLNYSSIDWNYRGIIGKIYIYRKWGLEFAIEVKTTHISFTLIDSCLQWKLYELI